MHCNNKDAHHIGCLPLPVCSCYANSLLQALVATPPFAAYLVSNQHRLSCPKPSPNDWCALCELEKLATAAYDGDGGRVLNPKSLVRKGCFMQATV